MLTLSSARIFLEPIYLLLKPTSKTCFKKRFLKPTSFDGLAERRTVESVSFRVRGGIELRFLTPLCSVRNRSERWEHAFSNKAFYNSIFTFLIHSYNIIHQNNKTIPVLEVDMSSALQVILLLISCSGKVGARFSKRLFLYIHLQGLLRYVHIEDLLP